MFYEVEKSKSKPLVEQFRTPGKGKLLLTHYELFAKIILPQSIEL